MPFVYSPTRTRLSKWGKEYLRRKSSLGEADVRHSEMVRGNLTNYLSFKFPISQKVKEGKMVY